MTKVAPAEKTGGINVSAGFRRSDSSIFLDLEFENINSPMPVGNLAIQLNKNAFSLSPASQQIVCNPPINTGSKGMASVELVVNRAMLAPVAEGQPASPQVQVAIKNMATSTVFYFAANINLDVLFASDGKMDRTAFIESWKSKNNSNNSMIYKTESWKSIDDQKEIYSTVSNLPTSSTIIEQVQTKLEPRNISFIARRAVPNAVGQEVAYFSMKTKTGMDFLAEITFKKGVNACKVCVKAENSSYGLLAKNAIEGVLRG